MITLPTLIRNYESSLCGGQKKVGIRRFANYINGGERSLPLKVIHNGRPRHSDRYNFVFDPVSNISISIVPVKVHGPHDVVWAPGSLTILHKGTRYQFSNPCFVSKGTFGNVVSYYDSVHELSIALKIEGGWGATKAPRIPIERQIGTVVNNQMQITRLRYVTTHGVFVKTHYYIMQKLDGDGLNLLSNMRDTKSKQQYTFWLEMVEEVHKQLAWLFKRGYYYTDIKPRNILYSIHPNGISVHLTDLGSAVPDTHGIYYTGNKFIPTCPGTSIQITTSNTAKQVILYLLGILACDIADDYKNDIYASSIENYTYHSTSQKQIHKTDVTDFLASSKFTRNQKRVLRILLAWEPTDRVKIDLFKPIPWK